LFKREASSLLSYGGSDERLATPRRKGGAGRGERACWKRLGQKGRGLGHPDEGRDSGGFQAVGGYSGHHGASRLERGSAAASCLKKKGSHLAERGGRSSRGTR